ncbi:hypothetical protein PQX77_000927 [Marasmius sp. AFHP31]|nr:hypothetical protein PQX77_000927 [Marasmius sp. AFHP31]
MSFLRRTVPSPQLHTNPQETFGLQTIIYPPQGPPIIKTKRDPELVALYTKQLAAAKARGDAKAAFYESMLASVDRDWEAPFNFFGMPYHGGVHGPLQRVSITPIGDEENLELVYFDCQIGCKGMTYGCALIPSSFDHPRPYDWSKHNVQLLLSANGTYEEVKKFNDGYDYLICPPGQTLVIRYPSPDGNSRSQRQFVLPSGDFSGIDSTPPLFLPYNIPSTL